MPMPMGFSSLRAVRPGSAEAFRRRVEANPAVLQTMQTGTGPTGLLSNDSGGWSDLQNDYLAYLDEERAQAKQAPLRVREGLRDAGPSGGVGVLSGGDLSPRGRSGGSGGGSMPQSMSALARMGGGGGFDPTDDPRVQQALIQEALTELDYDPTRAPRWRPEDLAEQRKTRDFGRGLDQVRQKTALKDELEARYAPREAGRKLDLTRAFGVPMAQANAAIGDVTSEAEAGREWLPNRRSLRDQDFERRRELAISPASIAAQSRLGVAGITGQSRVAEAEVGRPDPAALAAKTLRDAFESGAFGLDEWGQPKAPPAELQQQALDLLTGLFSSSGGAGAPPVGPGRMGGAGPSAGPPSPAAGALSADIEGLIQDVIRNGLARTREEAIAGLRQRGLIR